MGVPSRTQKLAPPAWGALAEALSTYEWFKIPFENLVRRLFADAPAVLGRLNFTEPKRKVAGDLVDALRTRETDFQGLVIDALVELSQYDPNFPHLARQEDGPSKVLAARAALEQVVAVTAQYSQLAAVRERLRAELEQQAATAEASRAHETAIGGLYERFLALHASSNPQRRGKEFETFLNDLFALWDLSPRAAYDLEHEQIDGAFTFRTDD